MIILTNKQKDNFVSFLKKHEDELLSKGLVIIPIEIKDGSFILPEEILADERCVEISDELSKFDKRKVDKSELIEAKI